LSLRLDRLKDDLDVRRIIRLITLPFPPPMMEVKKKRKKKKRKKKKMPTQHSMHLQEVSCAREFLITDVRVRCSPNES
jgi:hypothetical protein